MGLTDFIAIYAAVLSTIVFFWNVNNSRSKLSVEIIHGLNQSLENGIYISIKNPSLHKVYVTSISLAYPYREVTLLDKLKHIWRFKRLNKYINWVHTHMVFEGIETGLPLSIEPRNSHSIFVPEESLQKMLSECLEKKFVAVTQDALWRNKYSPIFKMKP